MRNNFWKWLKRFFVVLPVIMMLLQILFSMGSYWRENATIDFNIGQEDFVFSFVSNGSWNVEEIPNPLLYNPSEAGGIYGTIQRTFVSLYGYLTGFTPNFILENIVVDPAVYCYELIIINFLTWWIFIELIFLFFRFITFLISWVNSLFDNTFKKINK